MKLFLTLVIIACSHGVEGGFEDGRLVSLKKLEMFVDDLPNMPKIRGYNMKDGKPVSRTLTIGMFEMKWRFHRDLPLTPVFAYGTSRKTAMIPGPTIEALSGIATLVEWQNHLPTKHILPWDPTIPTAVAPPTTGGIPTVVHLHGAIADPTSDGNSQAWFTSGFNSTGPNWSLKIYNYPNVQVPGNLWYHDHAMGLTRVNILAGLVGAYVVRDTKVEAPLGLPSGPFDRNLVVFDRSFRSDGSIYMNSTGDNPAIHPQWQPEYFGDAIVVNGKAWPKLRVKRRKYRFRILNASNARFFRLFFADHTGLSFIHVGSDSVYLPRRVQTKQFVVGPSEIVDIVVDFSKSKSSEAILLNGAPYPYPSGDPTDELNGKVMKFLIEPQRIMDKSRVPRTLLRYPKPNLNEVVNKRFITMSEYTSATDEPVHLYLNGKPFGAPVTEIPRVGTSEEWEVINLTQDNHPLHVHLGLFAVLQQWRLSHVEDIQECVTRHNDMSKCHVESYKRGMLRVEKHERGWKNVYQMRPGYATRILVRFAMLVPDPNSSYSYPFDASGEPGYVYHCHILDHEDNEMMRPFKMTN